MLYFIHLHRYFGSFLKNETVQFHKRKFPKPEDETDYPADKRSDSIQIDAFKTYGNKAMCGVY